MIDALPLLLGPEGYQISRSVRMRSSASAYFSRSAYPVASTGTQWSMSMWVKRGNLSTANDLFSFVSTAGAAQQAGIQFDSNGAIRWWQYAAPSYQFHKVTTAVFRDPSAWYHLHFVYDTTLATAAERCQIWVNGVRQTAFSTSVDPSLNLVTYYKTGTLYPYIGAENRNGSSVLTPFDGYLTEINFIDGQALTPSSFGETDAVTGVWKPKKYVGTYGTNGFYLNFSDPSAATAAAIGKDYSGNGNNWTPNNISVTAGATYDSMLDVPTPWPDGGNGRGNYATLNPLKGFGGLNSSGNLNITNGTSAFVTTIAAPQSGKWYFEFSTPSNTASTTCGVFARPMDSVLSAIGDVNTASTTYYRNDGALIENGSTVATYTAWSTGANVIGVALDMDAKTIRYYLNNTAQGASARNLLSTTSDYTVAIFNYISGQTLSCNFGQRPFAYTPPSGFLALNTLNLPTPTILKGNQFFDATTYTANGGVQTVTNSGAMQPDLVWTKPRSAAFSNILNDSVRGAQLLLLTNTTGAEGTDANYLTAFNSNGFSLGTNNYANGTTMIGWQWKEGPTQGFDIVTYTGTGANRTVAHNLGVAPSMMIVKARSAVNDWPVYHAAAASAANGCAFLNATNAYAASATVWNNTAPTSSVFTVGTGSGSNANGVNFVAYLFAAVAGFSRFGSYTGNGSADGPFCFTGFLPRFVMTKRTDTTSDWVLIDTARNPSNVVSARLYANSSVAEDSADPPADILSNGFKIRSSNTTSNANGGTYVFAAFASNPFKNSLAR